MSDNQNLPLARCRVLITRPKAQASELVKLLRELGAEPLELPAIAIQPAEDLSALDDAIRGHDRYDWIVFTSINAVRIFQQRLTALHMANWDLAGCHLAAVGPGTASALEDAGLKVEFVPETFVAEGALAGLAARGMDGMTVLLPRAEVARDVLPDGLRELGADVTVIPLYRTVLPPRAGDSELIDRLLAGEVQYITFTSASTVQGFVAHLGPERLERLPPWVRVAVIGPVTSRTAQELLGRVDVEAQEHTMAGLVAALVADRSVKPA